MRVVTNGQAFVFELIIFSWCVFVGCSPKSGSPTQQVQKRGRTALFDRDDAELTDAAAKITWLGGQTKPIFTVVIRTSNSSPRMDAFRKFHVGKEYEYHNDDHYVKEFEVSPTVFRGLLSAVRPTVQPLIGRDREELSAVFVRRSGDDYEGFEARLPEEERASFYNGLLDALPADHKSGRDIITFQFRNVPRRTLAPMK